MSPIGAISGIKPAPISPGAVRSASISPSGANGTQPDAKRSDSASSMERRRAEEAEEEAEVGEIGPPRENEEEKKQGLTASLSLDLVRISVSERGNLYQCSICG